MPSAGIVLTGRWELTNLGGFWQGGKVKERFLNMVSHWGGCQGCDSGDGGWSGTGPSSLTHVLGLPRGCTVFAQAGLDVHEQWVQLAAESAACNGAG